MVFGMSKWYKQHCRKGKEFFPNSNPSHRRICPWLVGFRILPTTEMRQADNKKQHTPKHPPEIHTKPIDLRLSLEEVQQLQQEERNDWRR